MLSWFCWLHFVFQASDDIQLLQVGQTTRRISWESFRKAKNACQGASTYTVNLESKNPVRSWMYDDIIYEIIYYDIPWAPQNHEK